MCCAEKLVFHNESMYLCSVTAAYTSFGDEYHVQMVDNGIAARKSTHSLLAQDIGIHTNAEALRFFIPRPYYCVRYLIIAYGKTV
jgi:hypothetical protein